MDWLIAHNLCHPWSWRLGVFPLPKEGSEPYSWQEGGGWGEPGFLTLVLAQV